MNSHTTRRNFLAGMAALPLVNVSLSAAEALRGVGGGGGAEADRNVRVPTARKPIRLAISSYSYWHFRTAKVSIETVIEKAAHLGAGGVDILHRQMEIAEKAPLDAPARSYLQKLKRQAFRNGVDLVCLSIHQDFVDPDPAVRQEQVDHTLKCIEIAYELGVPCIRLNSGRWNTIPDFDALMKSRGEEPVLPGHTEEEGFNWCIESIGKCLGRAAECGVQLALENHWGLTRTPEGLLRIADCLLLVVDGSAP